MTKQERLERYKKVLRLRDFHRKTFREIGEILRTKRNPICRERARQIYEQAKLEIT